MRCINKVTALAAGACLIASVLLTGCGSSLSMTFEDNKLYSNYNFMVNGSGSADVAEPFASKLCVADGNVEGDRSVSIASSASAALFDTGRRNTIYAKDIYTQLYPASLTKIMTALVALKYSTPDTVLTASSNVVITEANAQVAGIEQGDTMTLDQALHLLLIYSANDAAVLIAENVGGTVDHFIELMNEEAAYIGATNTNFINSNGLSDENHYTTVYDMYLIFQAALQYELFPEIINMSTYSTVYHDQNGQEKEVTVNSTNQYLTGGVKAPTGVTVIGGKTGTTVAAGHCLIMMVRDTSGNPYIAVVMKALDQDALYDTMNSVLGEITGT